MNIYIDHELFLLLEHNKLLQLSIYIEQLQRYMIGNFKEIREEKHDDKT
jgi:hypothetical protein